MEENAAQRHVEFVKHTVVADAEFAFRPALQSLVWEMFQPPSHVINLALHRFTNAGRQIVKRLGKSVRPDWEHSGHGSFRLAGGVIAFGNLATGLIQPGLHIIGEFQLVFQKIVYPRAHLFDFRARQFWNHRFDFLHRTHGIKLCGGKRNAKPHCGKWL